MDVFLFFALGAALGAAVVDAGGGNVGRFRAGGDGDDDDEKKQPALPDLRPSHTTTTTTTSSQPLPRQRAQVSEQELIDDIMRELEQETKQEW